MASFVFCLYLVLANIPNVLNVFVDLEITGVAEIKNPQHSITAPKVIILGLLTVSTTRDHAMQYLGNMRWEVYHASSPRQHE